MNKQTYKKYSEQRAAKSNLLLDCIKAFLAGGLICLTAECLLNLYLYGGMEEKGAKLLVSVTLIFITAVLTGLGWFDKIAKHAGAGTLVPITGFANSVVSSAIDNKSEGLVLGLGAKIFIIAGPVILYGTLASALYGVILYIAELFL